MQQQLGTNHDHRAPRVVDALAKQVLAEAALLSLEHVGKRFQGPPVDARNGAAAAPIIEQSVHGLLQHALFITHNDVRRMQLHQSFQAVITVDHAPVKVVEVGSREAATVERHQGPKLRRKDRNHFQNHPLGTCPRFPEGLDQLQPLDQFLALRLGIRFL